MSNTILTQIRLLCTLLPANIIMRQVRSMPDPHWTGKCPSLLLDTLNAAFPQVLILDEISMVSAEMFHQLEHHARMIRGREEPFGGVQLVLSGDYFQ